MALLGMFNVHRHGAINSAAIVLYALTSCVSGFVSCSFYTQINGQRWVWNIILTSSLFSGEHSDVFRSLCFQKCLSEKVPTLCKISVTPDCTFFLPTSNWMLYPLFITLPNSSSVPHMERCELHTLVERLHPGSASHHRVPLAGCLGAGGLPTDCHRWHRGKEPRRQLPGALSHS